MRFRLLENGMFKANYGYDHVFCFNGKMTA